MTFNPKYKRKIFLGIVINCLSMTFGIIFLGVIYNNICLKHLILILIYNLSVIILFSSNVLIKLITILDDLIIVKYYLFFHKKFRKDELVRIDDKKIIFKKGNINISLIQNREELIKLIRE